MPAAIFLASSFHQISRGASARLRLEVDIRHGEVVGIADNVGDAAIFLDGPWRGEAALCRHVLRVNRRAARRTSRAPGMTSADANAKNDIDGNAG
jgi:hypothetical protein